MRRTWIVIALCLVLGFLTSIAVAWTLTLGIFGYGNVQSALFEQDQWSGSFTVAPGLSAIRFKGAPPDQLVLPLSVPVSRLLVSRGIGLGNHVNLRKSRWGTASRETNVPYWTPQIDTQPTTHTQITSYAAGWPFRCVRDLKLLVRYGPLDYWNFEVSGQFKGDNPIRLASATEMEAPVSLPRRPIWPGLIANTIIFASGWFSLLLLGYAWRRLRKRRRLKKHHCPQCAYDLRDSKDRCPECGWTVHDRIRLIGPLINPAYIAITFIVTVMLVGAVIVMVSRRTPTPEIIRAAYLGDIETVTAELDRDFTLIDMSYDMDIITRAWQHQPRLNPMEAAILGDQPEIVRTLIQNGARLDTVLPCGQFPIELATDWGRTNVVEVLLETGFQPCMYVTDCRLLLKTAVSTNDTRLVDILIKAGVPMTDGLLARATWEHYRYLKYYVPPSRFMAMIEHLVNIGAPISVAPLFNATRNNDSQTLQLLLEHDGDANGINRGTPLLCAITQQAMDINVAKLLIQHGAKVNVQTLKGITPLHLAVQRGSAELVQLLLNSGADPTQLDDTAMQFATPDVRTMIDNARTKWKQPTDQP